jgi:homoserine kinase type II
MEKDDNNFPRAVATGSSLHQVEHISSSRRDHHGIVMARYTQLNEEDLQEITARYALTVVGFEPIEGGAGNSSYLLRTQQGSYVLTVCEGALTRVIMLGQLLSLLAQYEFPTTRLVRPPDGDLFTTYMGKPVMLKEYITGGVFKDLDETMLFQVGEAMGRLHQVPAPDFLPDERVYGLQVYADVLGRNIMLEYESWLAERIAYLKENLPPGLPRGMIHGDLFYDNVIFSGKEFRAIIDFEDASRYYKVFDLGMGILGMCMAGTAMVFDKARALVKGYQQVRMLEDGEINNLQLFVEYAAIATSCWRFWKYHIDTPTPEKANKHWQMVRIADGVAALPKTRFVDAVFS